MSDLVATVLDEWQWKLDRGLTKDEEDELNSTCINYGLTFCELFERRS